MNRRESAKKISIPVVKSSWHPSPLLGQMVLVSSKSIRGEVHVAAKSWLSMVASDPPTLSLACRISHRTAINILETREFVVNVPGDDVSSKVWMAAESFVTPGDSEPPQWGFQPASRVAPPLIDECRAHLECVLDSSKRFNEEEVVLYGRILAVSIDEKVLQGAVEERYLHLRPLLFLEEGMYGVLEGVRRVEGRDEQA